MDTEGIAVRVRVGSYDFCHPDKTQTAIMIAHPELGEPLHLTLDGDVFDEFNDLAQPWSDIVTTALERWLEKIWIASDKPRAAAFLNRLRNDDELSDSFYCAWVLKYLPLWRTERQRLDKKIADAEATLSLVREQERAEAIP